MFFAFVTEAHNVLSDPLQRAEYDRAATSATQEETRSDTTQVARQNFLKGRALATQRKFNEALGYLESAVQQDPNRPEYRLELGLLLGVGEAQVVGERDPHRPSGGAPRRAGRAGLPGAGAGRRRRHRVEWVGHHLDARHHLGVHHLRVGRRAKAVGLVMGRSPHHIATDTFLPQIIGGLMEVVRVNKLRLLIEYVEAEHQDRAYLELARSKHIDGMILLTPRLDDAGLKKLEQVDVPTVLMGEIEGSNLYSVDVDNQLAAQNAVPYLLDLGHTQIACITNAPATYTAAPDRVRGYKKALVNAGIVPDDDLVRYADFTPESGYAMMDPLLATGKKFTAVFVASDNVAMGVKASLREAGMRIPEDISLVGFDDIPWAQYADPPLTTVHVQAQELARRACLVLMDLLKGKEPETKRQIIPASAAWH